jgi:hypothetical protein
VCTLTVYPSLPDSNETGWPHQPGPPVCGKGLFPRRWSWPLSHRRDRRIGAANRAAGKSRQGLCNLLCRNAEQASARRP